MEEVSQPWLKKHYHMPREDLFPPLFLSPFLNAPGVM